MAHRSFEMSVKNSEYKEFLKRSHDRLGTCFLWLEGVKCSKCPFINEDRKTCDLKNIIMRGELK